MCFWTTFLQIVVQEFICIKSAGISSRQLFCKVWFVRPFFLEIVVLDFLLHIYPCGQLGAKFANFGYLAKHLFPTLCASNHLN